MATQPTQNAVPSESPRDLKFNAGKIDEFVTSLETSYIDRFGVSHLTIEGIKWLANQVISSFGYVTIDSFQAGATLTLPNQVLRDTSTGEYYRWDGAFPKVVAAGSTPSSAGGIGVGAWLSVGYATLKTQLSSFSDNVGDALIGVLQPFQGAVGRTQHDKNSDVVSVRDFYARGDGLTDDSPAFSVAAKNGPASNISQVTYLGMPQPLYVEIYIPAGRYLLSSVVDTGGRNVVWIAAAGANFVNPDNLNGRLVREGLRVNNFGMSGILDSACGFSVANYRKAETPGAILGVTAPNQLATYIDRDTVALYADNYAPVALYTSTDGVYTLTNVTLTTALSGDQLKKLRIGMLIDTKHTPTKYTGVITSWSADGKVLTVEGWYLADGLTTSHSKVTPPNGSGIVVNPFTKAWAVNANIFIDQNSYAVAAVGMELGVGNDKYDYDPATDTWHTWCYDAITLGSKRCETAYMQRGYYYKGFESRGATGYNFVAKNAGTNWASGAVYFSQANSDFQILIQPDVYNNKTSFAVKKEGNVEIGRLDAAQTTIIDLHSSGNDIDYDARISVQGGTSTIGQANVTFTGGQFFWSVGFAMDASIFRPTTDSGRNLGSASYRFNTVFASTGAINTSDETMKTFFDIEAAELAAAKEIKGMIRKYKMNDAIEKKGDEARIHFGVGAQSVGDAMRKHGLNPDDYAFWCHDSWEDEYEPIYDIEMEEREFQGVREIEVLDSEGNKQLISETVTYTAEVEKQVVTGQALVTKAGSRYGIRYEELLCFIISAT